MSGIGFVGSLHCSTWLTLAGGAVAVVGMVLAVGGHLSGAVIALVIAGLCDLADGPIARSTTRSPAQRAHGVQLDSLVDVVSFLALPVAIAATVTGPWVAAVVGALYVAAGVTRLAAFTVSQDADGDEPPTISTPVSHYRGLPVTYAALVLPVLAWPLARFAPAALGWGWAGLLAVLGLLFVIDVPVTKPRGAAYAVFGVLAVAVIVAWAVAS
ncbi:CDP-alcohol phosphatidyltransferase family protein [Aestuariimicrobium soli]|uniref:CDP-alcohol phosphatidyltransferase family protein n=1 Tax=Aestuariimicrobium soli TaxID=2035834 RepID=UPI003EBB98E4